MSLSCGFSKLWLRSPNQRQSKTCFFTKVDQFTDEMQPFVKAKLFIAQSVCTKRLNTSSRIHINKCCSSMTAQVHANITIMGVNKNLNCQRPDRIFTNNLAVDSSTLKGNSLSHAEYQLRWHLMCIIIIVRLHVYFRFSCFKCEACVRVWHC